MSPLAFAADPVQFLVIVGGFPVVAFLIWRLVLRYMETRLVLLLLLLAALLRAPLILSPKGWVFLFFGLVPTGLVMVVLLIWLALPRKIQALLPAILGMGFSSLAFRLSGRCTPMVMI